MTEVSFDMEKVVGVDTVRPKLGEVLDPAEAGEVFIVTCRSRPKGVILGYSQYQEMRRLSDLGKRLQRKAVIDRLRERAEEAGLTEEDVLAEIGAVRGCER